MTLCAVQFCSAQSVEVSKPLPDGSVIVTIDGAELRAFPAEQMRELAKIRAERDSYAKQIAAFKDQVAILESIVETGKRIEASQAAMIARQDAWLESSGKLVFELQDALEAYRKAAKVGKVASALNHPAWRIIATAAPILLGIVAK